MNKNVIRKNKTSKKNTSMLGLKIESIVGVKDFNEREKDGSLEGVRNHIGDFKYNENKINYIVIKTPGIYFINFRMNISYKKNNIKHELLDELELNKHINMLNRRTIGVKMFISDDTDESLTISVNTEYVLDADFIGYDFVENALNVLSVTPGFFSINKSIE
ncbi:hypothetical protein [Pectobacterium polaris]|uniref:hypothetical protein n=1 Tax=Pectobacterium polaris TaxID=2042057 RepID=UPI00202D7673|nr:hypothetical protein [Pectobacterium polaris]MCL6325814.1 hypothetical protein [Pectobacterium polaris]